MAVVINTVGRIDVTLEVGALAERITVSGQALLLTTEKADVHTELGSVAVTNLPLDQYRNYQSLLVTVPGATPVALQNDITDTPAWSPRTITFSAGATGLKGVPTRSINQYAGALMGLVSKYDKSVQFFDMKTREWQLGWYVRDRWQATRNLTVNLGLRYEYYPLINRGDRGIERWDPATNVVYFGGLGNTPRKAGVTVSHKLFAPRIGFAYRLGNKTVIRSGYGLTFDPLPFGRPLRGLYPASISQTDRAAETYGWFGTLDKGIPEVATPDVSKGSVTLPSNVDMGPRSPWGGLLHRGYIQSWNFTVERELPWNLVASVGYVGNHTVHQLLDKDINASTTPGGRSRSRPLFATQGRSGGMNMWDGWADAHYNSLQVQVNRSYRGLFLKGAYTWSKAMNYADEDGWQTLPLTDHPQMLRRNRAPAGYDRRHMLVNAWVYELPFGRGRSSGSVTRWRTRFSVAGGSTACSACIRGRRSR